MRPFILITFVIIALQSQGQDTSSLFIEQSGVREIGMRNARKLALGGYAQIDYNQPLGKNQSNNGTLDVHRMVFSLGYQFNKKTSFFTEVEIEHVKEIYIEQAYLNYMITPSINLRAGLLLVPMGIINEYHEPTTFNGVERPIIDKVISPTTWREIGIGITGKPGDLPLKYQLYIMNGFNGYDGDPNLSGKNGMRKARQKGAESYISSPNFSGKIEFYGIPRLNIGFSAYWGSTQSTLYNGLDDNDVDAQRTADSSSVGMGMFGFDVRYTIKGVHLRGQVYQVTSNRTKAYNEFTGSDFGSSMYGYYIEAAYNVFDLCKKTKHKLLPFIRYESYNTHAGVAEGLQSNPEYHNDVVTTGIGWSMVQGAVLKADMQFFKSKADEKSRKQFNMGIGISF